ncbi:BRO family protein [Intestinibacter sp.]
MQKLKTFSNEKFGEVRATEINGEVWFVGKDITESLGYTNSSKALKDHVDEEDKGVTKCYTLGGKQNLTVINESGLYSLILSSKLPSAKAFKRWVTSEVLPQIRQNGSYNMRESYTIQDPVQRALAWAEEERVRQEQQKLIEKQEPLVKDYMRFLNTEGYIIFETLAKEVGIGRNKLMKQLRDWKILMTDEYVDYYLNKRYGDKHNQPYQKYMDKDFFVVKQKALKNGEYKPVTLITPKGATAIARKLAKEGLI